MILDLVSVFIHFAVDNLLGITGYRNIGIMRNNNHLSPLLCPADTWYQFAEDRLVVQIILWLINYNRLTFLAERKIEYEKYNPSFTGRQLSQISSAHFELEIHANIVKAVDMVVKFLAVKYFLPYNVKVLGGCSSNLMNVRVILSKSLKASSLDRPNFPLNL